MSAIEQFAEQLAAEAVQRVRSWRSWATFVCLDGGKPQGTDAELQLAVCKRWDAEVEALEAQRDALVQALTQLLERYTQLVNCGDCGFWDPETEPDVIAARAALQSATGQE